ncbi:prolyl-tRNA synthetase [Caldicellulosiruptor acetigenus I77R1B]|uniref:Proline--tRNA ligase n=1 Tax=Caldicellulosiruptor acetigenus (strain ATCC 700853 / DSM 12137 / I77R1B) TaxID=632335 RepID=E4S4Z3_CALA7|nr:proline--tRNA ligase [Caldicellulosiruptor acetigenus]ADQ41493.1 prolyl-tRNA synthetase [Caldicellulosiruptor acetigenus I77R1B]
MKVSELFMPTLKETPSDAEIESHKLMLRSGFMRQLSSGIYVYLPLGYRVLRKIENIVREEMDRSGAQEVHMSALMPKELWEESGRWAVFGPEMFRIKDRNEREYCLGPTHEEAFTYIVRNEITSYRDLPKILYQIQTKFRDERRPRFGVMRCREFTMKDAYSFDIDEKGLDISYQKMYDAYVRIFKRCGLDVKIVEADTGAMGGASSHEFMVPSSVGEAEIAYCKSCGYAANLEKAECLDTPVENNEELKEKQEVYTPNVRTIEELVSFLGIDSTRFVKTMIYKADDRFVAVLVRGDREVNETKLKNLLGATDLELASAEDVERITGAKVGFAGPIGLSIDVYADNEVKYLKNFVVGANKTDYHIKNVNLSDFKVTKFADLRNITQDDLCPKCRSQKVTIERGIEVGHIFKLGTKYTQAFNCVYTDEKGEKKLMIMGCYGIGINRTAAAIIEQMHDEDGIIWPITVAPYEVIVVPVNVNDENQNKIAFEIYEKLQKNGVEVLIDDRDERAGVKFKDADLIGIPFRVTVGKKVSEGKLEIRNRRTKESFEVEIEKAIEFVINLIKEEKAKYQI